MADVNIQLGYKTAAWFAANPTLVLLVGQMVYKEQTGEYKIGDGVTQLSALSFLGANSSGVTSFNSRTGIVTPQSGDYTKSDVGLSNVDNTSDANKPISSTTQTALDGKVDENAAITGATKTKITYDDKGLVTSGTDATTSDIADSSNKRYVTDAQLTVIGNTSNTNTGDETAARIATINHGATEKTTLVDADEITGQDSASSFSLIRVTCLHLYNYLKGKFDTVYTTASAVATQITTALSSERVFLNGGHTTSTPADVTTYIFGALPLSITGAGAVGGNTRIYFPINGTLVYARVTFAQSAGSNQTSTIYVRLNNTTDTILSSAVTNDATSTTFVNSSLSIAGSTTDYIEFKWVTPTWTPTNPTGLFASWELGFKL